MLDDIEVLDMPDDNYWMKTAYLIPSTPGATVRPGAPVSLRGIAMGRRLRCYRRRLSYDQGATWTPARLGPDEGKFGFRRWTAETTAPSSSLIAMVCATNSKHEMQPLQANWNGGGYMRNVVETVHLAAA